MAIRQRQNFYHLDFEQKFDIFGFSIISETLWNCEMEVWKLLKSFNSAAILLVKCILSANAAITFYSNCSGPATVAGSKVDSPVNFSKPARIKLADVLFASYRNVKTHEILGYGGEGFLMHMECTQLPLSIDKSPKPKGREPHFV